MSWRKTAFLAALSLFAAGTASAELKTVTNLGDINVELGGWYRARAMMYMFDEEGYKQVDFLDHRLRLEVNFMFSENVRLKTEFSGLEGVMWGSNGPTSNLLSQTPTNTGVSEPFVKVDTADGLEKDTFTLKRAWLEAFVGVGQLRVGRMGSHWGLGLLSNDGNKEESLAGDTYDRILFITQPLKSKDIPWYTVLLYSQIVEGNTGYLGDDIKEIVFSTFWTDDLKVRDKFIGLYLLYRHASESTAFSSDGTGTLADVYVKWRFNERFTVASEILFGGASFKARIGNLLPSTSFSGVYYEENPNDDFLDVEGSALTFMVKADYETEKWYGRFMAAGQLGADSDHVQLDLDLSGAATDPQRRPRARFRGNKYTLAIDSDVFVDYIMFREAWNVVTDRTPLPFDNGNGSLWNAYCVKLTGGYKTTIKDKVPVDLSLSLIWGAVADTDAFQTTIFDLRGNNVATATVDSSDLGIEVDLEAYFTFWDRFKLGLIAGYFSPGGFFKDFNEFVQTPNSYYSLTKTPGFTEEAIYTFQTRFLLYI